MSSGWLNQKERSYAWVLKLMLWLAVNLGRRPCRFLLYPITLYYLFFSKITKFSPLRGDCIQCFFKVFRVLPKKNSFFDYQKKSKKKTPAASRPDWGKNKRQKKPLFPPKYLIFC